MVWFGEEVEGRLRNPDTRRISYVTHIPLVVSLLSSLLNSPYTLSVSKVHTISKSVKLPVGISHIPSHHLYGGRGRRKAVNKGKCQRAEKVEFFTSPVLDLFFEILLLVGRMEDAEVEEGKPDKTQGTDDQDDVKGNNSSDATSNKEAQKILKHMSYEAIVVIGLLYVGRTLGWLENRNSMDPSGSMKDVFGIVLVGLPMASWAIEVYKKLGGRVGKQCVYGYGKYWSNVYGSLWVLKSLYIVVIEVFIVSYRIGPYQFIATEFAYWAPNIESDIPLRMVTMISSVSLIVGFASEGCSWGFAWKRNLEDDAGESYWSSFSGVIVGSVTNDVMRMLQPVIDF
ncbi:hypothetical protein Tco_1439297 [Tanacetum coccineum]